MTLNRLSGDPGSWTRASFNAGRPEDLPIYVNFKLCTAETPEGFRMEDESWPLVESFGYLTVQEANYLIRQLVVAVQNATTAYAKEES